MHVVFVWKRRFVFREYAELLSCVNETQRETADENTVRVKLWIVSTDATGTFRKSASATRLALPGRYLMTGLNFSIVRNQ